MAPKWPLRMPLAPEGATGQRPLGGPMAARRAGSAWVREVAGSVESSDKPRHRASAAASGSLIVILSLVLVVAALLHFFSTTSMSTP